jgi:hypothetical protein
VITNAGLQLSVAVLDPRISYEGMKLDYAHDPLLAAYLESSKDDLQEYFEDHYADKHVTPSSSQTRSHPPALSNAPPHSPHKDFTARFQRKDKAVINELEEYFKLPQEDFATCNPIHWWMGRRTQFPNLFWLARDLLAIPGMDIFRLCLWEHGSITSKGQRLQSRGCSREDETQYHCDVQVFARILSGF